MTKNKKNRTNLKTQTNTKTVPHPDPWHAKNFGLDPDMSQKRARRLFQKLYGVKSYKIVQALMLDDGDKTALKLAGNRASLAAYKANLARPIKWNVLAILCGY